ncbi:dihydroorotate dehydrogenase electron transfer subunit [Methylohalomonas lacus]|uniref:Dihydroorotate dehydrogenase electron transfer subunit n=1 Tax=Methylohalomonas lacus TaxID=398773 RepID=A0AAE3HMI4_9GAMM|nr:dihydroorotate dehydrogenase electron transfer subunit [Methylohalomonas lacus]MCS3903242.1 dihydroorotate dehydrogenase electron transfer subunit [Methylohalomonas lacus]
MNEHSRHAAAHPATRDTIFPEQAPILLHEAFAGDQHIIRLQAPEIAAHAQPGSFVHMQVHPTLLMRRPMSIMRANPKAGWIEILYKAHGEGTRLLSERRIDELVDLIGPIGTPFKLDGYRRRPLLIGGGVGMPPMIFLAEHIRRQATDNQPLVILGSEVPFPFKARPSQILVPGLPAEVIAGMPLLEDWHIPSRLCSQQDFPGCHQGFVTDLARLWLDSMEPRQHGEVEVFACGPTPMLKAVAQLTAEYDLPCQVSLEEHMACAVGGCAGCNVRVETETGPAMKRICVDGPVFDARQVFPQAG